jgi:catechol 2,3-dioxygenase
MAPAAPAHDAVGMSGPAPITGSAARPILPAALRLGAVHLTVSDIDRSVAWYEAALGLRVHRRAGSVAELGDGAEVVVALRGDVRARPGGRHAGLYHYALLYPTREALARAAVRLAATRTPIEGASDHGTHEAIYLRDPDGNGIELAADRPRAQWPTPEEEFSGAAPRALDFDGLFAMAPGHDPGRTVAEGLRVGHVHLHVGDIARGLAFYRDVIGFEEWFVMPSAAFVAAGGYHHHLGFNTWRGEGVGPAPEHVAGLRHWTIALPSAGDVAEVRARVEAAGVATEPTGRGFAVRDPWDIELFVETARGQPAGITGTTRCEA